MPDSAYRREFFTGLIRIQVLLLASHAPIFGLAMMDELKRRGYRIGPGTLDPLLHGLERAKLLKSRCENIEVRRRRVYKITISERNALGQAREKANELHQQLHGDYPRK
jgi:PadR family transcriptional regulator, regulatory protein PadR